MEQKSSDLITVLHVDDNEDFLDITARFLRREDERLTVRTATTAKDGLTLLDQDDIDCVVSDYDMPEMNGIDFLKAVREDYPDCPFILFTGKGSEEVASDAISAGVTDYLQKEGGNNQYTILANRIQNAVEHSQAQRALTERDRQFEAIFEDPEMLVGILDPDGTLRRANQTAMEFIDVSHDEVTGKPFWETPWCEETPTADIQQWIERAAGGDYVTFEATYPHTNDGSHSVSGSIRPVTNDDGEVVSLIASGQDITARKRHEQTLGRIRDRMEFALDATDTIIYEIDLDTYQEKRHGPFERLYGIRSEVVRETDTFFEQAVHPDDRDRLEHLHREEIYTIDDETVEIEYRTHPQNGDVRWLWSTAYISTAADGTPERLVGIVTDITERKAREREYERYETLVEAVSDGIYILDDDLRFTLVNDAMTRLTGYSRDHLRGMQISALFERELTPAGKQAREELLTGDQTAQTVRAEIHTADGDILPCEFQFTVLSTESGVTTAGVVRDISARRETEARLEAYISNAADILGIVSEDGVFQDLSPSVTEVLGYDPCTLEEEYVFDYVHPDDRERIMEEFVELVQSEPDDASTKQVEYRFKHADGSWQWLESVGSDQTDSTLDGYVIVTRDISERKQREKRLKRQNEQLDEFASLVAHDLRNPLNVAAGQLELAREDCSSEHLDSVEDALERSQALIDDLLTLAREGDRVSNIEPVNLASISQQCWQNVATAEATITVETDRTIRTDRSRFQQLLENLYRNAIKHGGDDVTVTVGDLHNGIYVADDGPGIPAEERDDVFAAGYSTTDEGTGFGLSIVRQIVEAHGWDIHVTNSSDGGARFEITSIEFGED